MYNFQVQQRRKENVTDKEACKNKELNGNISTIDALALATEAKGQLNGIITNVLYEHICDHTCSLDDDDKTCPKAVKKEGHDNKAYLPDALRLADSALVVDSKESLNTHL